MTTQQVKDMISARVHRSEPNAKVLLFGSRARGDARSDSDWDVMVLLGDDAKTDRYDISDSMIRLGWDVGEVINPLVYKQKEWEMKSFTPFFHNVMRDKVDL